MQDPIGAKRSVNGHPLQSGTKPKFPGVHAEGIAATPARVAELRRILNSRVAIVKEFAEGLKKSPQDISMVAGILLNGGDWKVKERAALSLWRASECASPGNGNGSLRGELKNAVSALAYALTLEGIANEETRIYSAKALWMLAEKAIDPGAAMEQMIKALSDDNPHVRLCVARAFRAMNKHGFDISEAHLELAMAHQAETNREVKFVLAHTAENRPE